MPLGLVALGVLAVTLPGKRERVEHSIDYVGTALLAAALSALVLATTLGGTSYDWNSPFIIALGVITVVGLAAFVVAERHAKEPILPPSLFRNRVFTVTSAVGLVVGFALFGGLTFLPLFQQVVRGDSPTESGLQLLPVMAGLLFTSILSGQVITRTGRYRWFPIAGTAIGAVGLLLLAQLDRETSTALAALYMLIFGMGLGMVMQVLVLAVQNSVDYEMLGVATSGATLFRSIGGALGTALLGAVFSNKLAHELAANLPLGGRGAAAAANVGSLDPSAVERLPAAVRDGYLTSFTESVDLVFLVAAGIMAIAFLLTWLIPERPLRDTVRTAGLQQAFAAPEDTDSVREVARELSILVGREGVIDFLERAAARADLDIAPAGGWLLARAASDGTVDVAQLAAAHDVDLERLRAACRDLHARELLTDGPDHTTGLTPAGARAVDALADARCAALDDLVARLVARRASRAPPVRRAALGRPRRPGAAELDGWFGGRRESAVVRLWMPGGDRRRGTVLVARARSVGAVRRRRRAADGRAGRGISHLAAPPRREERHAGQVEPGGGRERRGAPARPLADRARRVVGQGGEHAARAAPQAPWSGPTTRRTWARATAPGSRRG